MSLPPIQHVTMPNAVLLSLVGTALEKSPVRGLVGKGTFEVSSISRDTNGEWRLVVMAKKP